MGPCHVTTSETVYVPSSQLQGTVVVSSNVANRRVARQVYRRKVDNDWIIIDDNDRNNYDDCVLYYEGDNGEYFDHDPYVEINIGGGEHVVVPGCSGGHVDVGGGCGGKVNVNVAEIEGSGCGNANGDVDVNIGGDVEVDADVNLQLNVNL